MLDCASCDVLRLMAQNEQVILRDTGQAVDCKTIIVRAATATTIRDDFNFRH
jgi:hypothetical protein